VNNLDVIDQFTNTFGQYIDGGFGLVGGQVHGLAATLIAIDVTLAALMWVMGGADDVIVRLIKKVLYVGAFAFIITNFNSLAQLIFNGFASLGLTASGSSIGEGQLLQPGRLATVGVQAGQPLLQAIGKLTGFPEVFTNLDTIVILLLAFIIVVLSFFIVAVQVFVAIIEFKLTTLAGFVLVPFALWNKTSFLAEKVLGAVVASGVKILVLAIIVGIGTSLFSQFTSPSGGDPDLNQALALILASISFLGIGIFGPGIAGGLISGAPQLGAGAAVGATAAATGAMMVGGAGAAAAGRLAGGALGGGLKAATTLSAGARTAYASAAAGQSGARSVGAGLAGVAKAGAQGAAEQIKRRFGGGSAPSGGEGAPAGEGPPGWAAKFRRDQAVHTAASAAAHAVRSGDHGGAGPAPSLDDRED
jgi:type IV secretion system protein TrbL